MSKRFLFFENFKSIADKLPNDMRLKFYDALLSYVFDGVEPDDAVVAALITAIKPSLDKEDKRGGLRDGAGAPKGNQNAIKTIKNNQKQSKNILDNQNNQSFLETGNRKQEDLKTYSSDKSSEYAKRKKISFEEVVDWETLFDYWEQHKKGGKYKNAESRSRMLAELQKQSGEDFELAKKAITYAVDNNYQGFTNGSQLFYRNVSAAPASRKTADDDAAYWAELERRVAENDYE